jgi:uncharacterized protein YlzI (FlbEa/FlbD family)
MKPSQEDIENLYSKLNFKLFTLKIYNGNKYYVDNDTNLVWNNEKKVVGYYNNDIHLFEDDDKLISL